MKESADEEVVWFCNPSKAAARARREQAKDAMGRELWYNIMAESSGDEADDYDNDEAAEEQFYFYDGGWHSSPPQPGVAEMQTETITNCNIGLLKENYWVELDTIMGSGCDSVIDKGSVEDLLLPAIDAAVVDEYHLLSECEGADEEWFLDPSKEAARARPQRAKEYMGAEIWSARMQDSDDGDYSDDNEHADDDGDDYLCRFSSSVAALSKEAGAAKDHRFVIWAARVGRKIRGWATRLRRKLTPSCIKHSSHRRSATTVL